LGAKSTFQTAFYETARCESTNFTSCAEAHAAGYSNIHIGSPAYSPALDRDGDGIACESGSGSTAPPSTAQPTISANKPTVALQTNASIIGPKIMYTNTSVNLREKANPDSKMITTLGKGEVVIVDSCDSKWCKVRYGKAIGYTIQTALQVNSSPVNTSAAKPVQSSPTQAAATATTAVTPTGSSCPKFALYDSFVVVTVPAKFPNPQAEESRSSLKCGNYNIQYIGDDLALHKKIYVKANSWKDAWHIAVDKPSLLYMSLQVDTAVRLDIVDGVAGVKVDPVEIGVGNSGVIALSINGGPLMPVLFNGKVTPQKLGSGSNKFYQKANYPYGDYQLIEVNTISQTVTFTPTASFPSK
ncbi:excalibur calcium-binding domain-containing protein, partial [Deinococcus ruber]|uniref:excalibur calcium-binding domain-containing protein n=1 Tax=Deinococcus ruber TaxID=1848197 RepID=UPI0016650E60